MAAPQKIVFFRDWLTVRTNLGPLDGAGSWFGHELPNMVRTRKAQIRDFSKRPSHPLRGVLRAPPSVQSRPSITCPMLFPFLAAGRSMRHSLIASVPDRSEWGPGNISVGRLPRARAINRDRALPRNARGIGRLPRARCCAQ